MHKMQNNRDLLDKAVFIIRKKGKLDTSHRYDLLPLLRSSPGGIQRELVVYDFPGCKGRTKIGFPKILPAILNKSHQMLSNISGSRSSPFSNRHIVLAPTRIMLIGTPLLSWVWAMT